jgi:hypothetical protein
MHTHRGSIVLAYHVKRATRRMVVLWIQMLKHRHLYRARSDTASARSAVTSASHAAYAASLRLRTCVDTTPATSQ